MLSAWMPDPIAGPARVVARNAGRLRNDGVGWVIAWMRRMASPVVLCADHVWYRISGLTEKEPEISTYNWAYPAGTGRRGAAA